MTKFREEDHPRDADGKFTDKSTPAEEKRVKELTGEQKDSTIKNKRNNVFGGATHDNYLPALLGSKKDFISKNCMACE